MLPTRCSAPFGGFGLLDRRHLLVIADDGYDRGGTNRCATRGRGQPESSGSALIRTTNDLFFQELNRSSDGPDRLPFRHSLRGAQERRMRVVDDDHLRSRCPSSR